MRLLAATALSGLLLVLAHLAAHDAASAASPKPRPNAASAGGKPSTSAPTASSRSMVNSKKPTQPNVLFVYVDDLRTDMGPYDESTPIPLPGLTKFASTALLFKHAYCSQPVCAPSRFSLLSGRRNDVIQAWNFITPMRANANLVQSIPQIFRDNGYYTATIGKVFHWISQYDVWDDRLYSWDSEALPADTAESDTTCPDDVTSLICACDTPGNPCVDEKIASQAVAALKSLETAGKPFFLGVGFRRPHPSFMVPSSFRDLYYGTPAPLPSVTVPPNFNETTGMPSVAYYSCQSLQGTPQFPDSDPMLPWTPAPTGVVSLVRVAYWTAAAFMDLQFSELMTFLDASPLAATTLVVFTSDHGWNLGERNMWCKQSLLETTTRVPLLMRVPWLVETSAGRVVESVVEHIDLMPTIVSLVGGAVLAGTNACPMGSDLAPFFTDPGYGAAGLADATTGGILSGSAGYGGKPVPAVQQSWALSQYPRCAIIGKPVAKNPWNNPCTQESPSNFQYMGYSLRTPRWRYTEWRRWTGLIADWSPAGLNATELYDHLGDTTGSGFDDFENVNVAVNYSLVVAQLSRALRLVAVTSDDYPAECLPDQWDTIAPTPQPSTAPLAGAPTKPSRKTHAPTPPTRSPVGGPTDSPRAAEPTGAPEGAYSEAPADPYLSTAIPTAAPGTEPVTNTAAPVSGAPSAKSKKTKSPTFKPGHGPHTATPTVAVTTASPTLGASLSPTTAEPKTAAPTTASPTSRAPSSASPTSATFHSKFRERS